MSFSDFGKELPSSVMDLLTNEGFDSTQALLCMSQDDIDKLKIKPGHVAIVHESVKKLQRQHQTSPFFVKTAATTSTGSGDLARLLETLSLQDAAGRETPQQPTLRWVSPHCGFRVPLPVGGRRSGTGRGGVTKVEQ